MPGEWRWKVAATPADDAGLNGGAGVLRAVAWSEAEINANPNRRGFVRASPNGHALVYADGSPFFLLGDTWLAASTLPLHREERAENHPPFPPVDLSHPFELREVGPLAHPLQNGLDLISFVVGEEERLGRRSFHHLAKKAAPLYDAPPCRTGGRENFVSCV